MKFILLSFCLFCVFILLLISFFVAGFGDLKTNGERTIGFDRTHTRAFCSDRICRDFLVTCSGSEVLDLKPISGFVTFSDDWVDLREDENLC